MTFGAIRTVLAALLLLSFSAQARAAGPEEERLLGSDRDAEQLQGYLPFIRAIGVSGVVTGTLADSTAAAGVPAAAMLDALKALGVVNDLGHDVRSGDRFYVRYEQEFTLAGTPIDVGRVLWAELQLSDRRTVGVYRFRPKNGLEEFWTGNAMATAAPRLRLPLDVIAVSSGFGLRVDPFDQPGTGGFGRAFGGFGSRSRSGPFAMHEGVDLVAPAGTPIHAAGDGIVVGAEPKGRYGNWIEIEHPGRLATVYGHLASFAPGIVPGAEVHRDDIIGYVGMTGRTTGPHVHFEVLVNGRPTNPIVSTGTRRMRLSGPDLVTFQRLMANDHAERDLETKTR